MEALMTRPQVKVEKLKFSLGDDPLFEAGSVHTAQAVLTNPTAKEFTYSIELYLDVTKVATSGVGSVTIPAGGSVTVSFTATMPLVEGTWHVYLDAIVDTELVAHYQATEDVTIVISPAVLIGPITWAS